ncbi:MAG: polyprenyl synthetase family protein [Planctomycetes bacterium]|nr:polyprenyl synthetase family protein [Planctomycetota bacterium]
MPARQTHSTNSKDTPQSPLEAGFDIISYELEQVRQCIAAQLVTEKESVNVLISHITKAWGKMLRPALVLLSGKACGQLTGDHIEIAAMLEMIHIATLLHDDVIDEAQSRRKQPTVNLLWGNESAVLLGDFLLGKVFAMAAGLKDRTIAAVLAETAIEICQGELIQDLQRGNMQLGEDEYIEIITGKTGALFKSCCYLGAVAAGGKSGQIEAMADYGFNTGIAFQITDDLLDVAGDEKAEGKTLGSDVDGCNLTLPIIHLLSVLPQSEEKQRICGQISSGHRPAKLIQLLEKSGSCEYAGRQAQNYCDKAVGAIGLLKDSQAKAELEKVVTYISNRTL